MTAFLEAGLRNAAMATVLALAVAIITRIVRRPAFAHALWLVVLLRLVMPPIWTVPINLSHLSEARAGSVNSSLAAGFSPRESPSRGLKPAATEELGNPATQERDDVLIPDGEVTQPPLP